MPGHERLELTVNRHVKITLRECELEIKVSQWFGLLLTQTTFEKCNRRLGETVKYLNIGWFHS